VSFRKTSFANVSGAATISLMETLDTTHETLVALRDLIPHAVVAGGSFASWLPDPRSLSLADREARFKVERAQARDLCVQTLLKTAGVDGATNVATGRGGERLWPAGFVGSLSDKGGVVLGALGLTSSLGAVGIDLERVDGTSLEGVDGLETEGLPPIERELGLLVALSAKEAVFKAQYPLTGRRLGFGDVRFVWEVVDRNTLQGSTVVGTQPLLVRCLLRLPWILSVALPMYGQGLTSIR